MAGNLNRVIIAFSVPTLLAFAFIWLRKRKEKRKLNLISNNNTDKEEEIKNQIIDNCQQKFINEDLLDCENIAVDEQTTKKLTNNQEKQEKVTEEREILIDTLEKHLNMHLLSCAKSTDCSKDVINNNNNIINDNNNQSNELERNSSNKCSKNKINLSENKLNSNNNDEQQRTEMIDIVNNNHMNDNEIKLKEEQTNLITESSNETESKCNSVTNDECDNSNTIEEAHIEEKVSPKLFSECFQTEKTKTPPMEANNARTRRETSGSGFVSCSSEAGSHNGNYSDIHSEGSCDSGKGGSDIQQSNGGLYINGDSVIIYQFELPQQLCGLLIGKQGFFIRSIKEQSDVDVVVNRHPYVPFTKICTIEGRRYQVKYALQMIRKRFPLDKYPDVTLRQINVITPMSCPVPLPQSCQLNLPDSVTSDVILSCMVDAGHFFLQQPTHPTYPSLSRLDQYMTAAYSSSETPSVPSPTPGIVCSVKAKEGWFRAVVVNVYDDEECEVKFVDYGGYSRIRITELRQIRVDFMTLPFQACECYLANVKPINDNWSVDANLLFEYFAQGQILQANIVAYADNNIPYVHLYMIQGASTTFINRELVDRGFALWIENM